MNKTLIIIALGIVCIFLTISLFEQVSSNSYRYDIIHSGSGISFLLDKKTGLIWKGESCKGSVSDCFSLIEYRGRVVPIGEQEKRNKNPKLIL